MRRAVVLKFTKLLLQVIAVVQVMARSAGDEEEVVAAEGHLAEVRPIHSRAECLVN